MDHMEWTPFIHGAMGLFGGSRVVRRTEHVTFGAVMSGRAHGSSMFIVAGGSSHLSFREPEKSRQGLPRAVSST